MILILNSLQFRLYTITFVVKVVNELYQALDTSSLRGRENVPVEWLHVSTRGT